MKITEALVVLFLVLFCYLFLDKFLFRRPCELPRRPIKPFGGFR